MKLALLSDIHANIQALEACLTHAQDQGAGQYAFLGDLVGYGADPVAVVQRVQALAAAGAWVLKGNHDAMAVAPPAVATTLGDSTAAWTHQQLSPMQRQYLDQLPLVRQEGAMLLVHATADEPALWRYVYDERAASASLDGAARASRSSAERCSSAPRTSALRPTTRIAMLGLAARSAPLALCAPPPHAHLVCRQQRCVA
jgi:hypothetical protein